MSQDNEGISKAQNELFQQISRMLTVPTQSTPLTEHRKWIVPCPDELALADYPEVEKLAKWLQHWTACGHKPNPVEASSSTHKIE